MALAEGHAKLAEGQGRMEKAIAHLATATEAALSRLTERIDEFGERVTRGFTSGAIHGLDSRVTKLERKAPKKRR